jgi:hypothetical protein
VYWQDVAERAGGAVSRAYALLREKCVRLAAGSGYERPLDFKGEFS